MSVSINSSAFRNSNSMGFIKPEGISSFQMRIAPPAVAQEKVFTAAINVLGGFFGVYYGKNLTKEGLTETKKAMQCKDEQGIWNGFIKTGMGSTYTGWGLTMVGSGVAEALPIFGLSSRQLSHCLIHIFSTVMSWLGVALYSLYVAGAVVALPELRTFRNAFAQMLQMPRISSKTKAMEVLQFLQAQVSLTAEDRANLQGVSLAIVEQTRQMKQDRFIRRVGKESAEKIEKLLPQLMQEVQAGKLENTEKLIAMVDRNSFKQVVKQIAMVAAGILGVLGSTLAIVSTGGFVSFALIAGSSVLYWLNGVIGNIVYKMIAPQTYDLSNQPTQNSCSLQTGTSICYKPRYARV